MLGRRAFVPQQSQVPVRIAERVRYLAEREQPAVRIGSVGEPAEHDGQQGALDCGPTADAARQRFEVVQRVLGIGVSQCLEPRGRGVERQMCLVPWKPRNSSKKWT